MKGIMFLGNSLKDLRKFPLKAKREAGYQLDRLQHGLEPNDWKPMTNLGNGVCEIRIHIAGQHRVVYLASIGRDIHVLHAFKKKSQKTSKTDIAVIQRAYKQLSTQQVKS